MKKYTVLLSMILLLFSLSFNAKAQTPSFNLQSLEGNAVNLNEFRGQVLIISFNAKGNPLAQVELPQLEKLATKYADRKVSIIWVCTNSSKPKADGYASNDEIRQMSSGYGHLKFLRTDDASLKQLGIVTLPTILVIDQQGNAFGNKKEGIDPKANLVGDLSLIINKLLTQ